MTALTLGMALQLQMSEFCAAGRVLFQTTLLLKNLGSACTNARSKEMYFYFSTEFPLAVLAIALGMR